MATRRERVGTVVLTALIVGGVAIPAHAEPAPGSKITAVPDAGDRPATYNGVPPLPTGVLATPASFPLTPLEYLRKQVEVATAEAQSLAERVTELDEEFEAARIATAWAEHEWSNADAKLKEARAAAVKAAVDAYMAANGAPRGFEHGSGWSDVQRLRPDRADDFSESTAFELDRATAAEKSAAEALEKAKATQKVAEENLTIAKDAYMQRDQGRLLLQERFLVLQTEEERKRERDDAKLVDYDPGKSSDGKVAHPDAQKVVRYALQQLGKPYRFSEEGPDYFDCSGLTWAGYYRLIGLKWFPRVSKDQYQATASKRIVNLDALLPGDLLFYASDKSNPRTIHHVMIYLGDSRVVHATGSGDKVKISKINLGAGSPVDFATRVIDAVDAPKKQ
ncbi:C40 family peptidase [Allorhizocola rhizosphaerae]|uniref:C40 family peptidase n=1 Tax=Allorhizocola rhizosphaerae TaxID=1872709 RepID=UPI0013C323EA|nr:C40 family peptidase [Allorhizocola rhizosphaerae]